jgi:hypothetical protein
MKPSPLALRIRAPVRRGNLAGRAYREQQPTFIPPLLLTSRAVPDGEA